MKVRIAFVLSAVVALAFAAVANAGPTPYKVTGGGQALAVADSSGVKGPGDTITFQAFITKQMEDQDATGHVNIVDRTGNTGKGGVHYKGVVDCTFLASDPAGGGYAELQGHGQTKDGSESFFVVRIRDNGQGNAADSDQIEFDRDAAAPACDEDNSDEDPEFFLARGNAKIHKESPSQSGAKSSKSTSTSTKSTSLTSLTTLR